MTKVLQSRHSLPIFLLILSNLLNYGISTANAVVPTVTSLSTVYGPKTGGTISVISGTDFTGTTGVTVGGAAATINSVTDTSLSITTPASATSGAKSVVVTNADGYTTFANGFIYVDSSVNCGTSGKFYITNNAVIAAVNCIGTVVIPSGVDTINACTFGNAGGGNCIGLTGNAITDVTLPSSMRTIGNLSFLGASTMTSINIPEGVTSIGNSAFYFGGKFPINIPTTVTSIANAFYRSNLTAITFSSPTSLRVIQNSTFRVMPNLTSIVLPEGITTLQSISFAAESGSQVLKWISLPSTLTAVDTTTSGAFQNHSLTCVVNPGNTAFINGLVLPGSPTIVTDISNCPAPTVSTVSSSSGTSQGGVSTQLFGTNLQTVNTVAIDGVAGVITARTQTVLTFTTPAGTVGAKDVVITTYGHSLTLSGGYTYLPLPTITSLSVTSATLTGGGTTVVTGTNLSSLTASTIGGTAATRASNTATSVTLTIPAGTVGAKDVVLTNANGTVTLAGSFTYYEITSSFSVFSVAGSVNTVNMRTPLVITATVAYASKITFKYGGTRIAGCISRSTPASAPFTVTCTWKPTRKGSGLLTATAVPVAGGISTGYAVPINITVGGRSNTR